MTSNPSTLSAFNPVLPRESIMGRIKKLKESFGFIAGDDGQDYFFHWASIQKRSEREFRELELRDRVSFIPQPPRDTEARGMRGIEILYIPEDVRVIPEGTALEDTDSA